MINQNGYFGFDSIKMSSFAVLVSYRSFILSPGMGIFHRSAGLSECLQETGRTSHAVEPSLHPCNQN